MHCTQVTCQALELLKIQHSRDRERERETVCLCVCVCFCVCVCVCVCARQVMFWHVNVISRLFHYWARPGTSILLCARCLIRETWTKIWFKKNISEWWIGAKTLFNKVKPHHSHLLWTTCVLWEKIVQLSLESINHKYMSWLWHSWYTITSFGICWGKKR